MTKQFYAISALAVRKGFVVAELQTAIVALLYALWLTYRTPESARLLAVDAYSASFLAIGSGQLIGIVQRRYSLRRVMTILAVLMWVFTAFYSFNPAQLVFAATAAWAFLRIGRGQERSTTTLNAGKELIGMGPTGGYALHDV